MRQLVLSKGGRRGPRSIPAPPVLYGVKVIKKAKCVNCHNYGKVKTGGTHDSYFVYTSRQGDLCKGCALALRVI